MSRPRLVVLVVVVAVAAVAAAAGAGYYAGHRAGQAEAAALTAAADRAAASARAAAEQAAIQARAENSLAEIERAGGQGVCWEAGRRGVLTLAPPIVEPGGETCPRSDPRFTPAQPQPSEAPAAEPGG